MLCPACGADTVVLETRPADTHSNDIARRRRCMNPYCKHTFSTREHVDVNLVVKRQPLVAETSVFKPFTPQESTAPARAPAPTPTAPVAPPVQDYPRATRTTLKGHRQQTLDDWTQAGVVGTIGSTEQPPE